MSSEDHKRNQSVRNGLGLACKEHLVGGQPITRFDAMVLYGVQNLPDIIKEMRKQGYVINSKQVTYAQVMQRLKEHCEFSPPKNLPIREIWLTDYWISR